MNTYSYEKKAFLFKKYARRLLKCKSDVIREIKKRSSSNAFTIKGMLKNGRILLTMFNE